MTEYKNYESFSQFLSLLNQEQTVYFLKNVDINAVNQPGDTFLTGYVKHNIDQKLYFDTILSREDFDKLHSISISFPDFLELVPSNYLKKYLDKIQATTRDANNLFIADYILIEKSFCEKNKARKHWFNSEILDSNYIYSIDNNKKYTKNKSVDFIKNFTLIYNHQNIYIVKEIMKNLTPYSHLNDNDKKEIDKYVKILLNEYKKNLEVTDLLNVYYPQQNFKNMLKMVFSFKKRKNFNDQKNNDNANNASNNSNNPKSTEADKLQILKDGINSFSNEKLSQAFEEYVKISAIVSKQNISNIDNLLEKQKDYLLNFHQLSVLEKSMGKTEEEVVTSFEEKIIFCTEKIKEEIEKEIESKKTSLKVMSKTM